ncbi:MAG: DUF4013 domain-containing protein [Candidatus Bathyarchaeota archaeon]|nr:DUF4013 domain-containing protein [Candidatus Bathyarchaeum tardum]WGM89188.1 MAG: DUF4013 domain-containing protein [Candidatus Bathyarchaeum tardum]WNZ28572.1 MAG: DUF4013 domain-containing protein [Candidatus Bathyarchaeota archaeon]
MKLDVNLTDSFNYTKLLFNDFGRLLILIILDIIPIVNLVVTGYLVKVIKQPKDSNELPALTNYVDLWVQGLKVVIAVVIVMIIPIVLVVPAASLFILSGFGFPIITGVSTFLAISLLLIGVLIAFFLTIILAMAIVNMVKHDEFGKVFAIGDVMEIIRKIGWGNYILWIVAIFICAVIVGAIGNIPTIGWLLSAAIAPIFGVFIARSAALTYMEGTKNSQATETSA